MIPEPGTVQFQGLFEGPTAAWAPQQDLLADALRRAGAPENCLHAVVTGGRASLEPDPGLFPRGQFADNPADCLAMALELLLAESAGGQPAEWFSSLRVIEYQERTQVETLIQIHEGGVRGMTREQPWSPVPKKTMGDHLRANRIIYSLAALALMVFAYFNLHKVEDAWNTIRGSYFAEDFALAEDFEMDLGGFATFLEVEATVENDGDLLVVTLVQKNAFPQTPRDFDLAREQVQRSEAIALAAIELGRAQLVLHFEDGLENPRTISLSDWESDGSVKIEIVTTAWRDNQLSRLEMKS